MDPSWAKAPSGNFQAKNQIPLTKISLQGNFPRSTDKTGAEHHASPGCQNGGNAAVFYWVVFNWCTWFWYRMSMMSMSHLWYLCAGLHQKTGLPKNTCFASGGHHKPAIPNDFLEMGFPHHSQMVVYCWVCKAYLREYPHKIWPEIWYSTSICWILKFPLIGWWDYRADRPQYKPASTPDFLHLIDRNTHPFPLEKWTSFSSKKNVGPKINTSLKPGAS